VSLRPAHCSRSIPLTASVLNSGSMESCCAETIDYVAVRCSSESEVGITCTYRKSEMEMNLISDSHSLATQILIPNLTCTDVF
jgi:hypothetical protein